MRIRRTDLSGSAPQQARSLPAGKSSSIFANEMSQQDMLATEFSQSLNLLGTELDSAGDTLSKEPTLANFKRYKDILGRITAKVTHEAYRLEKFGGTAQNPRYYEIVTVINHEVDQMYKKILLGQKDNMAITAHVVGIKGLVVDLIS